MKLNWFGKLQMNNPARAALQRRYSAARMLRLGGDVEEGHVLEVGCGRGVGIEVILERFAASTVTSFDLDIDLVRLARRRIERFGPDRARVYVADVTAIPAPDSTFDAVFDFGAIHQVVDWRQALSEVARVLKPSGRYFFEAVTHPVYRFPMNLAMERGGPDVRKIGFAKDTLFAELLSKGIEVGVNFMQPRVPITAVFVGDIIGVGRLTQ
ncbi:MAG: class I SAM-dependent methyltransferase [Actinomycetota bacterium]|nr:class I SAM-dependent methyltransferase [Actinomycetota bacterium]